MIFHVTKRALDKLQPIDFVVVKGQGETMGNNRKEEVVRACLNLFVERGLYNTSTRDLSKALNLQSGGLYYYFRTKDDAVIACLEAAITQLEEALMVPVKKEITEPTLMINRLLERAKEMAPTMKFVVTVCADKQYEELTKPILDTLGRRYVYYSEVFADLLHCKSQELNPFVYMCITSITNYMIFGEESFIAPQIKAIRLKLERLLESNKQNTPQQGRSPKFNPILSHRKVTHKNNKPEHNTYTCTHCSATIPPHSKYCCFCGEKLKTPEQ